MAVHSSVLDAEGLGAMIAIVSGAQTGTQLGAEPGTAGWTGRIRTRMRSRRISNFILGRGRYLVVCLLGARKG
jgi:hypothetical protein